ncbi:YvrJ family protein [Sporosarcina cyprini]|uniref:YvrJ family protein n=1 Tax=Sporosarcina cyprini TaxID=2910523 RepID=UPI00300C3C95
MLDEITIIQMIGNGAFPILITLYLLQRFEKKINKLELEIHELINVIDVTKILSHNLEYKKVRSKVIEACSTTNQLLSKEINHSGTPEDKNLDNLTE